MSLDYHSSIIGKGGETIRKLMNKYDVRIKVPVANEKCEDIVINGTDENVDLTIKEINDLVTDLDRQTEDRVEFIL